MHGTNSHGPVVLVKPAQSFGNPPYLLHLVFLFSFTAAKKRALGEHQEFFFLFLFFFTGVDVRQMVDERTGWAWGSRGIIGTGMIVTGLFFYGSWADHLLSDIGYSRSPWSAAPFPAYGGRQLLFSREAQVA